LKSHTCLVSLLELASNVGLLNRGVLGLELLHGLLSGARVVVDDCANEGDVETDNETKQTTLIKYLKFKCWRNSNALENEEIKRWNQVGEFQT
jgi:hypothetical protein